MKSATSATWKSFLIGGGRTHRRGFLVETLFLLLLQKVFDIWYSATQDISHPMLAILSIFSSWMLISLFSRRGHDIGIPGWASVLFLLVCTGSTFSSLVNGYPVFALITTLLPFLSFAILPSSPFNNRWGPAPHKMPAPTMLRF